MILLNDVPPIVIIIIIIIIIMPSFITFESKLHTILNTYEWINTDILFERSLRPQKEDPG
jgi:hypothetical protein